MVERIIGTVSMIDRRAAGSRLLNEERSADAGSKAIHEFKHRAFVSAWSERAPTRRRRLRRHRVARVRVDGDWVLRERKWDWVAALPAPAPRAAGLVVEPVGSQPHIPLFW